MFSCGFTKRICHFELQIIISANPGWPIRILHPRNLESIKSLICAHSHIGVSMLLYVLINKSGIFTCGGHTLCDAGFQMPAVQEARPLLKGGDWKSSTPIGEKSHVVKISVVIVQYCHCITMNPLGDRKGYSDSFLSWLIVFLFVVSNQVGTFCVLNQMRLWIYFLHKRFRY